MAKDRKKKSTSFKIDPEKVINKFNVANLHFSGSGLDSEGQIFWVCKT